MEGVTLNSSREQFDYWNPAIVDSLINELPADHPDAPCLRIVHGLLDSTGLMRVVYSDTPRQSGVRQYAYPSYQNVTKSVRSLCARGRVIDVDIVNSAPTFLLYAMRSRGIEVPFLNAFVQNPSDVLSDIASFTQFNGDLKLAKRAVIVVMHGGHYMGEFSCPPVHFLLSLRSELQSKLSDLPIEETHSDQCEVALSFGSKVCTLYQRNERLAIECMYACAGEMGLHIRANMHDGLHVEGDDVSVQEFIARSRFLINRRHGMDVAITTKAFDSRPLSVVLEEVIKTCRVKTNHANEGVHHFTSETKAKEIIIDGEPQGMVVAPSGYIWPGDSIVPRDTKLLCIAASMGFGKTTQLVKFVSRYSASFPRILIVSPRITLTKEQQALFAPLGFTHYHDTQHDLGAFNRMIITYNSMHRLATSARFDLVIVDECRTVMESMVDTHINHKHHVKNIDLFIYFLQAARFNIFADADLFVDKVVENFIQHCFSNFLDRVKSFCYDKNGMGNRLMKFTRDEVGFVDALKSSLVEGERVVICCRTRRRVYELISLLSPRNDAQVLADVRLKGSSEIKADLADTKLDGIKLLSVTKDTPDSLVKDLRDSSAVVLDHQLVIITSKMAVGNDVRTQVDKVFIDASGLFGCTARVLLQMSGRFRNVSGDVIWVLTDAATSQLRAKRFLIERELSKLRNTFETCDNHFRNVYSFYYDIHQIRMPRYIPGYLAKIRAELNAEKSQNFLWSLVHLLTKKHFKIECRDLFLDKKLLEPNSTPSLSKEMSRLLNIQKVMEVGSETILLDYAKKKASSNLTSDDTECADIAYKLKNWDSGFLVHLPENEVCVDILDHYDEIRRIAKRSKWDSGAFHMHTILSVKRGNQFVEDEFTRTQTDGTRFELFDQLEGILGSVSLFSDIEIQASLVDSNRLAISNLVSKLQDLRSYRPRKAKDADKQLFREINKEFSWAFGCSFKRSDERKMVKGRRNKSETFSLCWDPKLLDLALRSTLFDSKPTGQYIALDGQPEKSKKKLKYSTELMDVEEKAEKLLTQKAKMTKKRKGNFNQTDFEMSVLDLVDEGYFHPVQRPFSLCEYAACRPDFSEVL